MLIEQRIRAVLFYSSLFIFLIGLPFILSFALGYKFDRRTFKFSKTGIIFLKTQPQGASIYLSGKLLNGKTPDSLRELLPGVYQVKLELEKHYPWSGEIKVEPNKATIYDKIILFPLRPNIKHINKENFDYYWVDGEKSLVYYINNEFKSVYSSDFEGSHYEKIAGFIVVNPPAEKWKFSPDREKLLYFNRHQIGLAVLDSRKDSTPDDFPLVIDYPQGAIRDVFWHSDNYHLVVVTDRNIVALEIKSKSVPVELLKLTKRDSSAFYNINEDTLYFIDSQRAPDGLNYDNLFKLELNTKTFPFQELIKAKRDE